MGLRINQNIAAQNAYRNLSVTDGQMSRSLERLSSGYRINRAADDAAGLAISEGLRSQVGGLKVAVRNAQDGISVVQTAEGALTETHSILQRMRDLAVQSANDANDADSRSAIDEEATALKAELDRIADKTTYNNIKLLDGNFDNKQFQVGYASSDAIDVTIQGGALASSILFADNDSVLLTGGVMQFTQVADAAGAKLVGAVNITTDALRATTSAQDTANVLNADEVFASAFEATVVVNATTGLDQLKVMSRTGNESAIVVGAATTTTGIVAAEGVATVGTDTGGGFSSTDLGVNIIDLKTQAGADSALDTLDVAIRTVSTSRAQLGALQNRFEHTVNNLNVAIENLAASESRIRDTDMAQEMMAFTRSQILSQAGTAMLAQANQAPQGVLQLLR